MRLSLNVNRNLDRDETLLQIFMMELSQPTQARGTGGEQHARVRTDEKRESVQVGEESLCKRRDQIARTACNLTEICRDAGLENASGRAIIRLLRPHN